MNSLTLTDLRQTSVLLGIANFFWGDSTVIDDIVTIGQSMGLEVDADGIEELFEGHCIELTAEDLEHLQHEQEKKWLIKLKKKKRMKKKMKKMSQVL